MKTHVLIVDDDPLVRSQLSAVLTFRGCAVQTARNGAEALGLLESVEPTFILLEMRTPVLDGWGFAREMQARGKRSPIVVMGPERYAERWAEEIHAIGFLVKPIKVSSLLACVRIPDQEGPATAA
jgi:DNA-binding NtrC family response regulator